MDAVVDIAPNTDAARVMYDRFGWLIDPAPREGGSPAVSLERALASSLPPRDPKKLSKTSGKPQKPSRLTEGSGCLITPSMVLVASDFGPKGLLPDDVDWATTDHRKVSDMRLRLFVDPPDLPFLFVVFGKRYDYVKRLRMTVSSQMIEICGPKPVSIRRDVVLRNYNRLVGIPGKLYREAAVLLWSVSRDPEQKWKLERAEIRHKAYGEDWERALNIARTGPLFNTPEHDCLSMLLGARDNDKAPETIGNV